MLSSGRRLEHALGALPVVYREALLLVSVEGLRPAEAAAVCGILSALYLVGIVYEAIKVYGGPRT